MSTLVIQNDAAAGLDNQLMSGYGADFNFAQADPIVIGTKVVSKQPTNNRFLLRFDLSGLPVGASLTSAELFLTSLGGAIVSSSSFSCYRVTQPAWLEAQSTWNSYRTGSTWIAPGGDYTTDGGVTTLISGIGDNLVFDGLETLVEDALAFAGGLLDLLVIGPENNGADKHLYVASSDNVDSGKRPKLTVGYTAPPGLSIVDHGDNTGATATIAGTASGSTNVVYVQNFQGDLGAGAWQFGGSIAGNGPVTLPLSAGHYFGYAASHDGGGRTVSGVEYFVVSDGLEALHSRCLAAVRARIAALAMNGVPDGQVVIGKLPLARRLVGSDGIGLPAIFVSPRRACMPPSSGTNALDDVDYDVLVTIFDRDNQEPTLTANLDRHLLWREQIARAFRNQRLIGVSEVINAAVEPAEGLLEEAWKHELMVSALLLRFTSRETRGLG